MEGKRDKFGFRNPYSSKEDKKIRRDAEVKRLMALGHTKKFARQAARRV
ncbi:MULTISPECIES: hypothetical protein [Providencia]|nr:MULTISPECIES: hypothetical protein [Providencia]MBQ0210180.1 hypothetical protein [Providencia rettgeri]MDR9615259.1 hypothetical protein [Providencia rettgeri]